MKTLKEVLGEYLDKEAESNIDPTGVDPRVRHGVEAKVRNAKQDLERIAREYKDVVMNNVVIIGVNGKTSEEFAQAAANVGAVAVDYRLVNKRLATNLSKRAIGNEYTSEAHFKLIDELAKLRLEYDMVQLPTPRIDAYSDGIYGAPLEPAIDKLLIKNYGSQLQSAVTRREIGKLALAARFSGKKLPVILYNLNDDVNTQYLPAPVVVIKSDGKVTENAVKKKLAEIRNLLNDKSKDDSQTSGQSAQTQEEA